MILNCKEWQLHLLGYTTQGQIGFCSMLATAEHTVGRPRISIN